MARRPFLFRMLLSLCLVVQGTGNAMAAVQMHVANDGSPIAMQHHDSFPGAATAAPCHTDMGVTPSHGTSTNLAGDDGPLGSPDCCKSGGCQCACVHPAQVEIPMLSLCGTPVARGPAMHALAEGRLAPVPTQLLRPPIA